MLTAQRVTSAARTARQIPWRLHVAQAMMHGSLVLGALLSLYPMVWIIITSLKSQAELYQNPFSLPITWVWSNFRDAWVDANIAQYFGNSCVVTIVSTALVLLLASM